MWIDRVSKIEISKLIRENKPESLNRAKLLTCEFVVENSNLAALNDPTNKNYYDKISSHFYRIGTKLTPNADFLVLRIVQRVEAGPKRKDVKLWYRALMGMNDYGEMESLALNNVMVNNKYGFRIHLENASQMQKSIEAKKTAKSGSSGKENINNGKQYSAGSYLSIAKGPAPAKGSSYPSANSWSTYGYQSHKNGSLHQNNWHWQNGKNYNGYSSSVGKGYDSQKVFPGAQKRTFNGATKRQRVDDENIIIDSDPKSAETKTTSSKSSSEGSSSSSSSGMQVDVPQSEIPPAPVNVPDDLEATDSRQK